jgi:predicted Rossmann fold nucleotide-binding protein DprA/Smf involved in DNA uptake
MIANRIPDRVSPPRLIDADIPEQLRIGLGTEGEGMSLKVTTVDSRNPNYPAALLSKKGQSQFPRISIIGDPEILKRRCLGLFCSVKCPGDLILRTYDLARELRDAGVPVIGGFHTPIEKDCLDLLLRGRQPVVICPARDIKNMRLGKDLKAGIGERRILILSPFAGMGRRPTAQLSERRNQFVSTLAAAAFVAYAGPGGKTEAFAKDFMGMAKPLYTFESPYNKSILEIGAKPVNPKTLAQWAGSLKA